MIRTRHPRNGSGGAPRIVCAEPARCCCGGTAPGSAHSLRRGGRPAVEGREASPRLLADAARRIAEEAGAFLRSRLPGRRRISHKGKIDLVTEVDRASERLIARRIREAYPDDDILGEEKEKTDRGARRRWIVDPLDGTVNYAHGFPIFGVSVAVADGGEVVAGAVCIPLLGETFTGWRGGGAWLGGRRLRVSRTRTLEQSLVATGFPYDLHEQPGRIYHDLASVAQRAQGVRRPGCASYDLCSVAAGRFDGFWELRLHPWDTAAGMLLVEEAGGRVSTYDGGRYTIWQEEIVASNGRLHAELVARLSRRVGLARILRGE